MHLLIDINSSICWLNWRVLLCLIIVVMPMIVALFMIWKFEVLRSREREAQDIGRALYDEDVWRPCLKQIHPLWLLAFRVLAFGLALSTITVKAVIHKGSTFYYYTQWTFALITFYFGFGILLSVYGCYQNYKISTDVLNVQPTGIDAEEGYRQPLTGKAANHNKRCHVSQAAGVSSYLFQVIFQISGGAVMLTDCVYWTIIFPFLTIKDYNLSFMTVNLHTLNALLLLGDTVLNSLRFPWFRISYFILWTSAYVIFQWALHASISTWWPYPFLDLSSTNAPLSYLFLALMHLPCYGIFALIVKSKHNLLSKWFPNSYQCR